MNHPIDKFKINEPVKFKVGDLIYSDAFSESSIDKITEIHPGLGYLGSPLIKKECLFRGTPRTISGKYCTVLDAKKRASTPLIQLAKGSPSWMLVLGFV